jgi:hypothetical protein
LFVSKLVVSATQVYLLQSTDNEKIVCKVSVAFQKMTAKINICSIDLANLDVWFDGLFSSG